MATERERMLAAAIAKTFEDVDFNDNSMSCWFCKCFWRHPNVERHDEDCPVLVAREVLGEGREL